MDKDVTCPSCGVIWRPKPLPSKRGCPRCQQAGQGKGQQRGKKDK